jgi:adenosylcobinamide-GDP ribazoletransferase
LLLASLGSAGALRALAGLLLALGVIRALCLRQIGGQTGDTAGALEQIGEIAVLLAAVSIRA